MLSCSIESLRSPDAFAYLRESLVDVPLVADREVAGSPVRLDRTVDVCSYVGAQRPSRSTL